MNLAAAFTSKRVKERLGVSSFQSWWILIFLIVLVTIPDHTNKWAKWAILSLVQAYPVSGGCRYFWPPVADRLVRPSDSRVDDLDELGVGPH